MPVWYLIGQFLAQNNIYNLTTGPFCMVLPNQFCHSDAVFHWLNQRFGLLTDRKIVFHFVPLDFCVTQRFIFIL